MHERSRFTPQSVGVPDMREKRAQWKQCIETEQFEHLYFRMKSDEYNVPPILNKVMVILLPKFNDYGILRSHCKIWKNFIPKAYG